MQENDIFFLKKAIKVANSSKDKSTKVGSFFVSEDGISPIGFGYNGMPRGLNDDDIIKNERPEKYLWFEHAERNGIYNGAQPLMENGIIFSNNFLNMEAARAIVSVGLKKVVLNSLDVNHPHYTRVIELFKITKTNLIVLDNLSFQKYHTKLYNKYKNFMDLTQEYAEDLSHPLVKQKSASLILNEKTFSPIAMGASGPPPNLRVTKEQIISDGDNFWLQESEKNAIFNAVRSKFKNSSAYVSWCPCAHCSLALASVAVNKIVTLKPDFNLEADQRWKDSFLHSNKIIRSMNIDLVFIEKEQLDFLNSTNKNKYK